MTSPGATAVSSTSVPMRNWARLRVTGGDEGFDTAGWMGRLIGMIAQAVKNGIQASRKRAARHCIVSESNKERTQCHGGMRGSGKVVSGKVGEKWGQSPISL